MLIARGGNRGGAQQQRARRVPGVRGGGAHTNFPAGIPRRTKWSQIDANHYLSSMQADPANPTERSIFLRSVVPFHIPRDRTSRSKSLGIPPSHPAVFHIVRYDVIPPTVSIQLETHAPHKAVNRVIRALEIRDNEGVVC